MYKNTILIILIICIFSCQKENLQPEASFTINPKKGTPETWFYFNADGCVDDNSSPYALEVRWDFDNDGIWDTDFSQNKDILRRFEGEGYFPVKMEVKDLIGAIGSCYDTVYLWEKNTDTSFMTDPRDGRIYKTVKLEGRWWMAENLDYGRFIKYGEKVQEDDGIIEKFYLNNDSINYLKYGGIYFWDEAVGYSNELGTQGVCPPGWHIPEYYEWISVIKDYETYFFRWYLGQGGPSSFNLFYNHEISTFQEPKFYNKTFYYCTSGKYNVILDHILERDLYFRLYPGNKSNWWSVKAYYSIIRCIKDG
ncbi:FISUMP domain-containing protein [Bacteroidota bacterium]